jgi:hypothetical protein
VLSVPTLTTTLRSSFLCILCASTLASGCKPNKPFVGEVTATGRADPARPISAEDTAKLPDMETRQESDSSALSREAGEPSDAREEEVAPETMAPPADPLDPLPPEAQPLPANSELESLYQCVNANLARIPSVQLRRQVHVNLAVAIAKRDPPRGLATLKRATSSNPTPDESAALVKAIAERDLRRAVTMASVIAAPENRRRALEELVSFAVEKNGQWAVVISNQIRLRIPREIFLLHIIERLAESQLEDSKLLTERIIEPLLNDWAMALVSAADAKQDLDQALANIEAIESPVVRDWALLRLSHSLATSAPATVVDLLPKVQRSLVRDELLAHLSLAVVDSAPQEALAIALRIEEPELLRRGLDALARALMPHKPALARFMVERKREPPLVPEVWLTWLETACRDFPDAAPSMLKKSLHELSPEDTLAGLLSCCPGAPAAVYSAASDRDVNDDGLTRCYVCGGIMPDSLIAARSIRDAGVRDDALLCAIERLPASAAKPAIQEMASLTEPLLRDLAAVSLVVTLQGANESMAALGVAGSIVDPYLRAPALAELVGAADEAVASTAREAFAMALDGIEDSWRKDSARETLLRSLWQDDPKGAWQTLVTVEDPEIIANVLDELMSQPLSLTQIQNLLGATPPGAPLALTCLRSIALEPLPVEEVSKDPATAETALVEPAPAKAAAVEAAPARATNE